MAFDRIFAGVTVFLEASNQGPNGRRGVAWTLVNRLNSGRYGQTLTGVCLDPFQYSCWNTSDPDRKRIGKTADNDPILLDSLAAVDEAMAGGDDPTQGATLYYSTSMITPPSWAETAQFTVQIGDQRFYKETVA